MPRQIVFTTKAAKPPATYSQAVKAAGLVFVSGTAPQDPATGQITGTTIQEQTRQCLSNIAAILEQPPFSISVCNAANASLVASLHCMPRFFCRRATMRSFAFSTSPLLTLIVRRRHR